MNRSSKRPPLFSQVAVLFFLFLAGANGFGVQYLAWLVPFSAYAGAIPAAAFMVTSGAFLLLVYNYWSGGVPWYLADSDRVGDYQGHLDYFQILTWASVLLLLWAAWKQIRTGILWEDAVLSHAPRRAWAVALLLIGCVILPMQRRLHRDISASIPFGKDALLPIVAERYSGLSALLSQMGRPADALEVARQAP